jgi:hypothetical protein
MAQVSVTLNTDNPFEASLLLQISMNFASIHRDAIRQETTGAQPEVAPPQVGSVTPAVAAAEPLGANPGGDDAVGGATAESASAVAPADVKPKRGRKAAPVEAEPEPDPATPGADHVPESTHYTIDDIRSALGGYTERHDLNAGIALLKQFDATRVSAVKEADYARFIEACNQ